MTAAKRSRRFPPLAKMLIFAAVVPPAALSVTILLYAWWTR